MISLGERLRESSSTGEAGRGAIPSGGLRAGRAAGAGPGLARRQGAPAQRGDVSGRQPALRGAQRRAERRSADSFYLLVQLRTP